MADGLPDDRARDAPVADIRIDREYCGGCNRTGTPRLIGKIRLSDSLNPLIRAEHFAWSRPGTDVKIAELGLTVKPNRRLISYQGFAVTQREKIKAELLALVDEGERLLEKFRDAKEYPSVHGSYQSWYSKGLRAMEWLARDRYEEFHRYYEPDPKRKALGYGTYVIQDYLKGVKPGGYNNQDFDTRGRATICLFNQLVILGAVVDRADSILDDINGTLFAELQDEEIDTAESLLKVSPRAAGALAGVILESHLQKVAVAHGMKIAKKAPTIADLNDLLKAAGVYDTAVWRKLSYLADIRNLCSHKKTADPSSEQCKELIEGVRWVAKNIA